MNIFFIDQVGTFNYLNDYLKYAKKKKNSFKVFLSQKLSKIVKKKKLPFQISFVKQSDNVVTKIFERFKPKKIILSSRGNSSFEKRILFLSKKKKIKTYSIVDTWDNFRDRFKFKNKYFLPDCILCIDDHSKKRIEKIFKNKEIIPVGQPYLENILFKNK